MTTVQELEQHRAVLNAHCMKMLGAAVDADDAVQETLVRAWRSVDKFDQRSSLRTWLTRIATNVCLDVLSERARRWRPLQEHSGTKAGTTPRTDARTHARTHWAEPVAREMVQTVSPDASEQLAQQQRVRLAFVAALQHLPAKQRAVLLLTEVMGSSAQEIAEALETSVASVNSALQRARTTLSESDLLASASESLSDAQRRRLERYVSALSRDDAQGFAGLLHEDAGFRLQSAEQAWAIRFRCWRGCLGKNQDD